MGFLPNYLVSIKISKFIGRKRNCLAQCIERCDSFPRKEVFVGSRDWGEDAAAMPRADCGACFLRAG